MPNGRSGGFLIEKADLKHLVQALPDATVVAKVIVHSPPIRSADAKEVARLVDECPSDRIAVEEQDHNFYIIHLSYAPKPLWAMVGQEMPIFRELRQRHDRWKSENPDWKAWIGF